MNANYKKVAFKINLDYFTKIMGYNLLTETFWKNSLVPDLAIVPRCLIKSSFVIPIPVSVTWRMLLSLSALILIENSSVASRADLSVRDRNRILSSASEALEISSRRKICQKRRGQLLMCKLSKYHKICLIKISTIAKLINAFVTCPPLYFCTVN